MDIPLFKDLTRLTPIAVKTIHGDVQMIFSSARRGSDRKKWCISIDGYCREEVSLMTQCYVFFKGAEIGGNFSKVVKQSEKLWAVTFETIISIPEFWGES